MFFSYARVFGSGFIGYAHHLIEVDGVEVCRGTLSVRLRIQRVGRAVLGETMPVREFCIALPKNSLSGMTRPPVQYQSLV